MPHNRRKKTSQVYADCPHISGELHLHIRALSDYNTELKELKWSNVGLKDEDLVSFCNSRSALLLFYMNGINMVRIEFKDRHSTKDWFKPFLRAMLIWDEDTYRHQIGLPSLLPNDLKALEYSTFMNMVVNGVQNPLYEWEMTYNQS